MVCGEKIFREGDGKAKRMETLNQLLKRAEAFITERYERGESPEDILYLLNPDPTKPFEFPKRKLKRKRNHFKALARLSELSQSPSVLPVTQLQEHSSAQTISHPTVIPFSYAGQDPKTSMQLDSPFPAFANWNPTFTIPNPPSVGQLGTIFPQMTPLPSSDLSYSTPFPVAITQHHEYAAPFHPNNPFLHLAHTSDPFDRPPYPDISDPFGQIIQYPDIPDLFNQYLFNFDDFRNP